MTATGPVFVVDANVLIDYVEADPSMLALMARCVGPIHVPRRVLRGILRWGESDCEAHGLSVVTEEMDELTAAATSFDYALYHLDGTCQMRFLDQIAAVPNVRGIQWNPEPGENRIEDPRWIESFRAIRQRGLLLQFNCWESRTVEQVIAVVRALGPDGLMFALPAFASEGEAVAALERIERECR